MKRQEISQPICYKIILIGNSSIGKTSFFRKLSTGEFHEKNISTIGLDRRTFDMDIINDKKEKKSFNIKLFDTAGQERFRSITTYYYKGSQGALLIYDILDRSTFDSVSWWVNSINETLNNINNSKCVIILIGNKSDLINMDDKKREVTEEEAKIVCEKLNLIWGGEISIKNIGYEELMNLFQSYVKQIYDIIGEIKVQKQKVTKIENYRQRRIIPKKIC